jgi:hypothetical protein
VSDVRVGRSGQPSVGVATRPRPNVGVARSGGLPGPQGPQGPAGPGITYRGYWTTGTTYALGDVVTYLGQLYISNADFTSVTNPTVDTTNWSPVDTIAGPQGPQGSQGSQGTAGRGLEAIQGTLASTGLLPPPATAQLGDAWIIGDDLWILK